ncbi:TetR/AcrR family transcriptional regulator [Paenibacillaceae bacterium WGS1546]|uniref:TetR/AcrR family transcriptional regulator n=1 Tax=Cohnella sp. WGS1546 TaxID=3366810 RepID=UPI00372D4770
MERKTNEDELDWEAIDALPNGAKLGWGLVKQPTRGPKGELSIRKIVDTAIEIADREGLAAMSMSRIAAQLGFTTMSLYRYVSSKDDLMMLVYDAACEMAIPPESANRDWRDEMRAYVKAMMELFGKHPWLAEVPITGLPIMPNNMRGIDWLLRAMREFPLSDGEKMSIVLLLSSYALSNAIVVSNMERAIQAGETPESISSGAHTAALMQLVKPDRYPYLHAVIQSGAYTEENENQAEDERDFGLERILDGIQHYLEFKKAAGGT